MSGLEDTIGIIWVTDSFCKWGPGSQKVGGRAALEYIPSCLSAHYWLADIHTVWLTGSKQLETVALTGGWKPGPDTRRVLRRKDGLYMLVYHPPCPLDSKFSGRCKWEGAHVFLKLPVSHVVQQNRSHSEQTFTKASVTCLLYVPGPRLGARKANINKM